MAASGCETEEEISLIEAIYTEELIEVIRSEKGRVDRLVLRLTPATGDDLAKKYVCLNLEFTLSEQYPHEAPAIRIYNARGLAEEHITELTHQLLDAAREKCGESMLYDLIEIAKESLTQSNVPHGNCAICLTHFEPQDVFTKTSCYHYFHTRCLYRYVCHEEGELQREKDEHLRNNAHMKWEEKKATCPMCRAVLDDITGAELVARSPDVREQPFRFVPSEAMRAQQRKMAEMLERQRQNGGLIDLEQQAKKYLLSEADSFMPVPKLVEPADNGKSEETTGAKQSTTEWEKPQTQSQRDRGPPHSSHHRDSRHRERGRDFKEGTNHYQDRHEGGGNRHKEREDNFKQISSDYHDRSRGGGRNKGRGHYWEGKDNGYHERPSGQRYRGRGRNYGNRNYNTRPRNSGQDFEERTNDNYSSARNKERDFEERDNGYHDSTNNRRDGFEERTNKNDNYDDQSRSSGHNAEDRTEHCDKPRDGHHDFRGKGPGYGRGSTHKYENSERPYGNHSARNYDESNIDKDTVGEGNNRVTKQSQDTRLDIATENDIKVNKPCDGANMKTHEPLNQSRDSKDVTDKRDVLQSETIRHEGHASKNESDTKGSLKETTIITEDKSADMSSEKHKEDKPSHDRHRPQRTREFRNTSHKRGDQGYNSKHGDRGYNSKDGDQGYNSKDGDRGYNSKDGDRGYNSKDGDRGYNSKDGDRGYNSKDGDRGYNSKDGDRGYNSKDGDRGYNSKHRQDQGYNSKDGDRGYNSKDGDQGYNSKDGDRGYNSKDGDRGYNSKDGDRGYNSKHRQDQGYNSKHDRQLQGSNSNERRDKAREFQSRGRQESEHDSSRDNVVTIKDCPVSTSDRSNQCSAGHRFTFKKKEGVAKDVQASTTS